MAISVTLKDILAGFLSASAINANNTLIENGFTEALNRTSNAVDNAMEVDLDMGNNNLINVNLINGEDFSNFDGNITAVAGSIAEITTVANDLTGANTIGAVATDITNVNSVATNIADVTTVAADLTGANTIGTVVANLADISTVVANIVDINTTAANIANVNTVATDIANVNTVATNIADVNSVGTNITDVVNVSNNIDDVNSFAVLYLGSKTIDPTLDNDGNPLITGALYFNSVAALPRIYDGTTWKYAAFSATDAIGVDYDNLSSGLTAVNVQEAIDEIDTTIDTIATSITDGSFNPSSATSVWTGSATTVPMASLSEQGDGWYLIKRDLTNTWHSIYVISGDECFGSAGLVTNSTTSFGLTIARITNTGTFSLPSYVHDHSSPSTTLGTIIEIRKV